MISKITSGDQEDPLEAIAKAEGEIELALASVTKGQDKILKAKADETRNSKGPFSEARRSLLKLKTKKALPDARCRKQIVALHKLREKVNADAQQAVAAALRMRAEKICLFPDALFTKLSMGNIERSSRS